MKFRICNECQQKMKRSTNQLTHDGLWEVTHYCKQCDIHYQDLYCSCFDETEELDMGKLSRYFQYTEINEPDDAERVRHDAIAVVSQVRDLLFELAGLENDLVDGLLEHYQVTL